MSNSAMRFNDVVSIKEYGKYNDNGEYKINAKNQYMIDLIKQSLQKTIGTCTVINKEYCNKLKSYNAIESIQQKFVDSNGNEKIVESYSIAYEPNSNSIGDNPFLNLIQLCNIVLDDRQLSYFTNKLEQPCIKVISAKFKNTLYYVRDKDNTQSIPLVNPIGDTAINTTAKKGYRKINDDDVNEIVRILDLCNLTHYLNPLAIKVDNKKKATA